MDQDQVKVLEAFYKNAYDDYCYGYSWIKDETGLDRKPAFKAVHALLKLGYLEYVKGLMTDDGEVAGSGFWINHKRKDHIKDLLISEGVDLDEY